jgi:hypothetical protein
VSIELRIRNLKTREVGVVAFETEAEAHLWLKARPPFVDVMGMAGQASVSKEVQDRLKGAMRPLDDDERLADREIQLAADQEDLVREKAARAKEAEEQVKHAEAQKGLDPERLMEVRWRFDSGMALTDANDPRAISEPAKEAVLAWIAERNEWVAGRGQMVGECTVKVWPGKMPAGKTERVAEGRFFPVSAGEEKS